MKHALIQTYCDWPGCALAWIREHGSGDQPVDTVVMTVTRFTKGRKPPPTQFFLCAEHYRELTGLRDTLGKNLRIEEEVFTQSQPIEAAP